MGLAYFAGLAVWLLVTGPRGMSGRWEKRVTLTVTACGVGASIFLLVLMGVVLEAWCPLCALAHIINIIIFAALVWLRLPVAAPELPKPENPVVSAELSRLRFRLGAVGGAAALMTAAGIWLYYDSTAVAREYFHRSAALENAIDTFQNDRDFVLREFYAQPLVELFESSGADTNDADEPALTVFGRFDCKPCRCFTWRWQGAILPAFHDRLRVELRHVVPEMSDGRITDGFAVQASLAAEAARLQGGDHAVRLMHGLLYRYQNRAVHDFAALANSIGLDGSRLVQDMQSEQVRARVTEDTRLADRLGVTSTPAVFFNGRRVPDLCVRSRVFWAALAEQWTAGESTMLAHHAEPAFPTGESGVVSP